MSRGRSYLKNAVDTALAVAMDASSTTMSITAGHGARMPAVPFYVVIDPFDEARREYIHVTTRDGDEFGGLTRNLDGSAGQEHIVGTVVRVAFTAQNLDDLWDITSRSALDAAYFRKDAANSPITGATTIERALTVQATVAGGEFVETGEGMDPSLTGVFLPLSGGTMSGIINAGSNRITNVADPTDGTDAVNRTWVVANLVIPELDGVYLRLDGTNPMSGAIQMGNNKITGLATPTDANDAVTKAYADSITPPDLDITYLRLDRQNNPAAPNDFLIRSVGDDRYLLRIGGNSMNAALDMSNNKIVNLTTPTDDSDAATKQYVDNSSPDLDPTYLRLDGSNNPAAPNNFLTQTTGDARFLRLTGGQITGDLTISKTAPTIVLNGGGPLGIRISGMGTNFTPALMFRETPDRWSFEQDVAGTLAMTLGRTGTLMEFHNPAGAIIRGLANPEQGNDAMTRAWAEGRYFDLFRENTVTRATTYSAGINFGSQEGPGETDVSRHIALWGSTYGFSITSGTLNIVSNAIIKFHGSSIHANNKRITNLGAPTADTDAATKAYADSAAGGSHTHNQYLQLSGGTITGNTNVDAQMSIRKAGGTNNSGIMQGIDNGMRITAIVQGVRLSNFDFHRDGWLLMERGIATSNPLVEATSQWAVWAPSGGQHYLKRQAAAALLDHPGALDQSQLFNDLLDEVNALKAQVAALEAHH